MTSYRVTGTLTYNVDTVVEADSSMEAVAKVSQSGASLDAKPNFKLVAEPHLAVHVLGWRDLVNPEEKNWTWWWADQDLTGTVKERLHVGCDVLITKIYVPEYIDRSLSGCRVAIHNLLITNGIDIYPPIRQAHALK